LNVADARFVFGWDGTNVIKLENGVDGAVLCLVPFNNHLVVAGAFTNVYKQKGSVRTGGLAMWDGQEWTKNPLGAVVEGVVTTMATNGTILYIGGRFKSIGSISTDGIAMWDGTAWHALLGLSGEVMSLTSSLSLLFVAGSFQSLTNPDEETCQIVRWDGANTGWHSLGKIQGRVASLFANEESLYVGGDFDMVGRVIVSNLAVFRAGQWQGVGGGLNGAVHALMHVKNCLYVGGAFTGIKRDGSKPQEVPAQYAARYCTAAPDEEAGLEGLVPWTDMGHVYAFAPVAE
jgi:hypothetical protein